MNRNSLDDLVVPTPPYRAWRASLTMAKIEEPPAPPEKPKEKSASELAMDLRKEASEAREKIMAMSMPEDRKQGAIARIEAALNEGLGEFSQTASPDVKKPVVRPMAKPVLPRRSPPVHGIEQPTPEDIENAKREAAAELSRMQPEGGQKAFNSVQEEYEAYKKRLDAARAAGQDTRDLERQIAKYEPFIKQPIKEAPGSEPKPEATINLPVRELRGGKKAMVTGPGTEGGERAFVYEDKRPSTPPGSVNKQLAEDVAETQGKGVGAGQGVGKKYPKTEPKVPSADFDVEFKQPSAEQERQEFIKKTQQQWELERQAGEARRQLQIAKREGKTEVPPAPPTGRAPRMNLLDDKGPPVPPIEIPPQPGMPGGAIPENLRQAARQTEVGSERVNFKPSPEMKQKLDEAYERGKAEAQEREYSAQSLGGEKESPPRPPKTPTESDSGEGMPLKERPLTRIKNLGEQKRSSFFERWKTTTGAQWESMMAGIDAVLAKRQEGKLAKRNEKIEYWEGRGEEISAKPGWLGMASSLLWHEQWAKYHKWLGRGTYRKWERYNDGRITREDARNEQLLQGAARIDRVLDSMLERIDQYALYRDEQDKHLKELHVRHKENTELLGLATNEERQEIRKILNDIEDQMKDTTEKRGLFAKQLQKERKLAAKERTNKEELLSRMIRLNRTDTTPPAYAWLEPLKMREMRPALTPKPRPGARKIEKLAA